MVLSFCTNRKRICDILLVLNSNHGPILPRFTDIRAVVCQKPLFPYPTPILVKISGCSDWNRSMMLRYVENEQPKLTDGEIIF